MSRCGKCSDQIVNAADTAVCAKCSVSFHPTCTRVKSLDQFRSMSKERKAAWKCDTCRAETLSAANRLSDSEPSDNSSIMKYLESMRGDMNQQFKLVNDNVSEVKKELKEVSNTIEGLKTNVDSLKSENSDRKEETAFLLEEVLTLREELSDLKMQLNDSQQYSRRDNVEIAGVPYTAEEDLFFVLSKIAAVIRVPFAPAEISVAHRLPRTQNRRYPNIVVKFVRRQVKAQWMSAARRCEVLTAAALCDQWESTGIYINDHLTPENKQLLGQARSLVKERKLAYAWTSDSRVLVRKTPDGPASLIRTIEDLRKALNTPQDK